MYLDNIIDNGCGRGYRHIENIFNHQFHGSYWQVLMSPLVHGYVRNVIKMLSILQVAHSKWP